MKLKFAALGLISVLLLAALLVANYRRKQSSAYILSRYPKNSGLEILIQPIQTPNQIFKSVWLMHGRPNIGIQCDIMANGRVSTARNIPSWAVQGGGPSQLTPTQMRALQKMLRNMPPNATQPALENILVVHYIVDNQQKTRIYDRSRLPPEILWLVPIIGAPNLTDSPLQKTP